VGSIKISHNNLDGSIPTLLGKLDDITVLSFAHNALTGSIPSELGLCFRLKELFLEGNKLEGQIPPQLGELGDLQKLYLDNNNFQQGTMPAQICSLRKDYLTVLTVDCQEVTCDCCSECM
jgi:LRR receptor-like serine/threonine-protein kinase FLS2